MPPILVEHDRVNCPHGAAAVITPRGQRRVRTGGQALLNQDDMFRVGPGCCFTLPGTPPPPHPCVTIELQAPTLAARVKVDGAAAVLLSTVGLCKAADQLPQGQALVTSTQSRVKGL